MAYQALQAENKIGTMLPCNVIVQEREPGIVEVSAVNPAASMMAVKNDSLGEIAKDVQKRLTKVIQQYLGTFPGWLVPNECRFIS